MSINELRKIQDEIVRYYLTYKNSIKKTALRFNTSIMTMYEFLKEINIVRKRGRKGHRTEKTIEFINTIKIVNDINKEKVLINEKLIVDRKISDELKVRRQYIGKLRKNQGLPSTFDLRKDVILIKKEEKRKQVENSKFYKQFELLEKRIAHKKEIRNSLMNILNAVN